MKTDFHRSRTDDQQHSLHNSVQCRIQRQCLTLFQSDKFLASCPDFLGQVPDKRAQVSEVSDHDNR